MNQHKFVNMAFCTAMVFFLISCGGGGSEGKSNTGTTTSDTSTETATTAPTPTNTSVTTPHNMMIAMHRVKDFAKWKASYDEHDSMRLANGVHSFIIGRGLLDSNMVFVVLKVDDVNRGKAFAKNPSLKQAMQKGGVVGPPIITFVTIVWHDTAMISTDLRSSTEFIVKDWDKWKKSFDSAMQSKTDNGLIPRAYGHDVDDNHKVNLSMAVSDTAKARTFWESDQLKQIRSAGGVVSESQRFVYRVVQKY